MSAQSVRNLWKSVVVISALAFLYSSVLAKLGYDWWTDENYSHGLLIPFIIGFIIWTERTRLKSSPQRPLFSWGSAFVLLALFVLWVGTAGSELFAQRISLVLMLVGIVIYFWGFKLLRVLVVPFVLLLLTIPIPALIFNKIAFPLQIFASRCAVLLMQVFDIPVHRQGNVIELIPRGSSVSKKMEVVEACSGIRSLMTLVTLAVVFAYFTYPRGDDGAGTSERSMATTLKSYAFWRTAILVFSAVPIAIITNALRVGGTGVLAYYFGSKIADGFFHSVSGWVVYILAFLLLITFGWLLDRLHGAFIGKSRNRSSDVGPKELRDAKDESSKSEGDRSSAVVEPLPLKGVE